MPNTIEDLEAQAAQHRARLHSAVRSLAGATSFGGGADGQPGGSFSAVDGAAVAMSVARKHPVALAAAGLGAYLLVSRKRKSKPQRAEPVNLPEGLEGLSPQERDLVLRHRLNGDAPSSESGSSVVQLAKVLLNNPLATSAVTAAVSALTAYMAPSSDGGSNESHTAEHAAAAPPYRQPEAPVPPTPPYSHRI